jgi:hypothetical protein
MVAAEAAVKERATAHRGNDILLAALGLSNMAIKP